MAVLARVHITSQQRMDLPQFLGIESYTAYDFRALIEAFVGSSRPYIARGFEVTGKTGLFLSISLADCFVFNPLDTNGSFYLGAIDASDMLIELPPSQPFVYVEARFSNITNASVSASYWDPLSVTGSTEGAEFTATQNSQNIIQIEIVSNTVGFSIDAVPICVCQTSSSAVPTISDARPLLFRLGTGGAAPNPGYKFPWSNNRGEPVTTGSGIANDTTSSFQSRDNTGVLNDKGIRSFKEMFDAICTRISEISGASVWYSNNSTQAYTGNLSLSSVFFDSVGHSLKPDENFIYNWDGSNLGNIGSNPATWQANYTNIVWKLGNTFQSGTNRSYSDVQFDFSIPDGSNAYLLLEREVSKNSGNNVIWKASIPATTYPDFINNWEYVVSGVAGDFSGVAVGDYVRKESQGYSQYYKIVDMATSTAQYPSGNIDGIVADNSVVTLKLQGNVTGLNPLGKIDTYANEPFKYFRSKYSISDIQVLPANQNATSCDFYWIARRAGDFIWLRDYGPMWRSRSWQHLDRAWSKIKLLKEYQNLFMSGGGDITFESVPGNNTLEWDSPINIEIAGRNSLYQIPTGNITITDGQCIYVDIPETDTGSTITLSPVNIAIGNVPIDPNDSNYSDRILVLWHRRGGTVTGIGDAPDLDSGETDTIGHDLPLAIRTRLGILSETQYVAYSTTYIISAGDSYPVAISKLDNIVYSIITDTAKEEIIVLGSDTTTVTASILSWIGPPLGSAANVDIQVFVNDLPQTQDQAGLLNEDFRKNSTTQLEWSYTLKAGWKIRIRDERTGGTGGGSGGIDNTASNVGTSLDGFGLFAWKTGYDLQFYRLKAGTGVTILQESNDLLISASGGGGGEANTASNRGSGTGLFAAKVGVDLQFKSLVAGTNVTLSSDSNTVTINSSGGGGGSGEANTASNLGTGTGLFNTKVGIDLQFKSLKALTTSGLAITSDSTSVTYSLAATGTNLGSGSGLFAQKNSSSGNFEFKSLKAGTNISLTATSTDITIAATGGAGGEANDGNNLGTGQGIYTGKSGVTFQFKSLVADTTSGLAITSDANTITYSLAATGTNLGSGTGLFAQKNATTGNFEFKSLVAGTNVTLSNTSTTVTINATGGGSGEVNDGTNLGTGQGIYVSKSGVTLQFKSLVASTTSGLSITSDSNTITYSLAATGTNLGSGTGLFAQKNATTGNFEFKSLVAGTNVTLSNTSTTVTINATGGGGAVNDTQLLVFDSGNIVIQASGTTADLSSITATKDFSTSGQSTVIVNKPTSVIYHSVNVVFTAAETTGRTAVALICPDLNGAITLSQACRPFAIRFNSSYGVASTSSTFTLVSGSTFQTVLSGYTAAQEAKASFSF